MVDFLRRLTFKTANLPYVFRIAFGCFQVVFGSFSARFGPFSHRFAWFSHRFFRMIGIVIVAMSFSSSPSSLSSSLHASYVAVVVVNIDPMGAQSSHIQLFSSTCGCVATRPRVRLVVRLGAFCRALGRTSRRTVVGGARVVSGAEKKSI